jgi:hypothetical protein
MSVFVKHSFIKRLFYNLRHGSLHENNDVLIGNSVGLENLVSVADISLVAVVVVTVGTGGQDNPQLTILRNGGDVTGLEDSAQGDRGKSQNDCECVLHCLTFGIRVKFPRPRNIFLYNYHLLCDVI